VLSFKLILNFRVTRNDPDYNYEDDNKENEDSFMYMPPSPPQPCVRWPADDVSVSSPLQTNSLYNSLVTKRSPLVSTSAGVVNEATVAEELRLMR